LKFIGDEGGIAILFCPVGIDRTTKRAFQLSPTALAIRGIHRRYAPPASEEGWLVAYHWCKEAREDRRLYEARFTENKEISGGLANT
jgi:hypothetical protein